ncbi:hypothetical protein AYK86_16275 [Acinetobacter venetianus]|jgi:hypothetical protein|uniref:Uncharacterized protein n=2 Tax=Acinetobacter TaxID=469 RepID=N8ZZH5_ACIVR|nr:hypothetical protein [Acinetobacter venetianus]MDA0697487.1 hypothetical protein [Pseudomonadota bacterium]ENV37183.1 hypothetical protein F959_01991 [Acinetobacter venetianus RAG-1 = CIP 110063]KXO85696.1 hypothetical protein AYK86_16275 [Acinetobacter venetianus]KXZ70040.1 hypothetical protein AVENLUH8758_01953 [Acinetobacter venetianus]MDA1254833.1 hypothetical protein [Pseudomonadota bacterium]
MYLPRIPSKSAFFLLLLNSTLVQANSLQIMDDAQLSNVTGQSLLTLSYISPNDSNNLEAKRLNGNQNIGFYKLGMEADIDLNANIRRLQLGCGGVNGIGCDIDIDYLSLSGVAETSTERASSSAKITNPFIEFAIRNPNTSSTREVVGLRLSAEKVLGLLTLGTQNSAQANGINSFSGYMKVQSGIGTTAEEQSKVKGYANTAAQYMDLSKYQIDGNLVALGLANAGFRTNGGGFNIPEMNNLPFETQQIVVVGNRQKAVSLSASVDIPTIYLGSGSNYPSGGRTTSNSNGTTTGVYTAGNPVNAYITSCENTTILPTCIIAPNGREFSNISMTGTVGGATATVNLQESLGFIHRLEINSAASLSLQAINILWPGSAADNITQPGWWLAFQDPVNIGRVEPTNRLSIEPLLGQFAARASTYLQQNPATTNDLLGVLTGTGLDVNLGNVDLSTAPPLQMNLVDLQLNGQNFAPNCYGNLNFC